ncbi:hypothetical protein M427DRAFT_27928 [Gonapodya prolifera JEL478]|uniref:Uncharacterized protein n=1 Tax=Gonapodya prolifera (strain JEL478) TaxID=1344416 RepID=A0A139AVW9_GONPJ|nr:hypothetical protein M427DRAFT_27928 [Gonapodya prolifera JEL478]|eukprot:KXS20844.1 hypothetical protein M427DRAFT_27928 [Gonapodya prolifera JEL478]
MAFVRRDRVNAKAARAYFLKNASGIPWSGQRVAVSAANTNVMKRANITWPDDNEENGVYVHHPRPLPGISEYMDIANEWDATGEEGGSGNEAAERRIVLGNRETPAEVEDKGEEDETSGMEGSEEIKSGGNGGRRVWETDEKIFALLADTLSSVFLPSDTTPSPCPSRDEADRNDNQGTPDIGVPREASAPPGTTRSETPPVSSILVPPPAYLILLSLARLHTRRRTKSSDPPRATRTPQHVQVPAAHYLRAIRAVTQSQLVVLARLVVGNGSILQVSGLRDVFNCRYGSRANEDTARELPLNPTGPLHALAMAVAAHEMQVPGPLVVRAVKKGMAAGPTWKDTLSIDPATTAQWMGSVLGSAASVLAGGKRVREEDVDGGVGDVEGGEDGVGGGGSGEETAAGGGDEDRAPAGDWKRQKVGNISGGGAAAEGAQG